VYSGQVTTFALSGFIRANAQADQALNRCAIADLRCRIDLVLTLLSRACSLAAEKKLMKDLTKFPTADKFKAESE
jgi:hypothetical protein